MYWKQADGNGTRSKSSHPNTPIVRPPSPQTASSSQTPRFTHKAVWASGRFGSTIVRHASRSRFCKRVFDEDLPIFSPDGRWLAYRSNESGRMEV